jgi:hypothetical protein
VVTVQNLCGVYNRDNDDNSDSGDIGDGRADSMVFLIQVKRTIIPNFPNDVRRSFPAFFHPHPWRCVRFQICV